MSNNIPENNLPSKRLKQRNILDKLIDRPVEYIVSKNYSPNLLSFLGFGCSVVASIFLGFNFIHLSLFIAWIPIFFIFMAGAFDVLDGAVARRTMQDSLKGAFLDSNIDRLSDAVLVFGLIYGNFIDYLLGYFLLFLTIMISYIRAKAESHGVDMKGIGVMERAERMISIMIALVIETWFYHVSYWITGQYSTIFFSIFIWIFLLLLVFTVGQRIAHTFKILK